MEAPLSVRKVEVGFKEDVSMTDKYYKSAKAKTFYPGDDFAEAVQWVMSQLKYRITDSEGCELVEKCAISIRRCRDNSVYKKKR